MRNLRKPFTIVALTVVLVGTAAIIVFKGCGCGSVPQGWRSASPPPQPTDLMVGAWEGAWSSDSKALRGKLTAVIERLPDGTYRASFDAENPLGANDKSVCIFRISARGEAWAFEGKEDLGLLKGGTYAYKGTVDADDFVCTYDSLFDKGVFRMQRRQATPSVAAPRTRPAPR